MNAEANYDKIINVNTDRYATDFFPPRKNWIEKCF